jgi:hypothetical protein
MPRKKNEEQVEKVSSVTPNDLGWTDYVLELLSEDEKIKGNPTTDGLRRIFEIAMNCVVTESTSEVCQAPDPNNGQRATVVHCLTYVLKDAPADSPFNTITVNGAADVYWGNCDKVFRNHPVAVAETRAEGRALRRALKLRKVVAAEELADEVEDIDGHSVSKISVNQVNFIDVLCKRLNINVFKLLENLDIAFDNVYNIKHEEAVQLIRELNSYQQNTDSIPSKITGYIEWK